MESKSKYKNPTTTIRIPPDLKENLEKISEKQSRSLNNLITVILQEYVDHQKSQ